MTNLSEEKNKDIKIAFSLFCQPNEAEMPKANIVDVFMSLGLQISAAECAKIAPLGKASVSYEELYPFVAEKLAKFDQNAAVAALRKALKTQQDPSGKINKKKFIETMTSCGEALSPDEVNSVLHGVSVDDDGCVRAEDILKRIIN
jgi:Ca2+-binding EF-hand superfamily protein